MGSKRKNTPDYNASLKPGGDNFGRVFVSMVRCPGFLALSLPARQLYVILRAHAASAENRKCIYQHAKETGQDYDYDNFIFPPAHQALYGYKDRANVRRYMSELIAAGFIRKVEDNRHRFTATVYEFSTGWKN